MISISGEFSSLKRRNSLEGKKKRSLLESVVPEILSTGGLHYYYRLKKEHCQGLDEGLINAWRKVIEMTQKVIIYIDGFNLYYGLREKGWRKYYWLNLSDLSRNLLKSNQELVRVKYFTARISGGDKSMPVHLRTKMEAKRKRQVLFLEALSTLDNLVIIEGSYLDKVVKCMRCGNTWNSPEEKMTDVNIATELLIDAYDNNFDTALLISGDSDLVPPIKALKLKYPEKRIVAAFPPERASERLQKAVDAFFIISESKLRKSTFPDKIIKKDGFILTRPSEWI